MVDDRNGFVLLLRKFGIWNLTQYLNNLKITQPKYTDKNKAKQIYIENRNPTTIFNPDDSFSS